MSSSLEAVFLYGYFGNECFQQLAPLSIVVLAALAFKLQG